MGEMDTKKAVLFVDSPATPLHPWESRRWCKETNIVKVPFQRVYLVPRVCARDMEMTHGCTKSRAIWEHSGQLLRSIAAQVATGSEAAYIYSYSGANDTDVRQPGCFPDGLIVTPPYTGSSGDVYKRSKPETFPSVEWWPGSSWASGTALFFSGDRTNSYLRKLDEVVQRGDWALARDLVMRVRFEYPRLCELMNSANLYLVAYSLEPPETADPWFFLPALADIGVVVEMIASAMAGAGFDVYISERIREFWAWQERGRLPSDARRYGGN